MKNFIVIVTTFLVTVSIFILSAKDLNACCCIDDYPDRPVCAECVPCGGSGGGTSGGGGWVACTGCGGDRPEGNATNLKVEKVTPTSALITWGGGGGCGGNNQEGYVVFIGKDSRTVASKCWDCGSNYPGNGGYASTNCTDKDAPNLPPGCNWQRVFGHGTTGFLTSGAGITFEPNTTYYVKVVTQVGYKDANDENVTSTCGGPTESFLGSCSSTTSAPITDLGVGDTVTFTTPVDQDANTTDQYSPLVTAASAKRCVQPPDPECTMMCQGTFYYVCGARIAGTNYGQGQDHISIDINGHHYEGDHNINYVNDQYQFIDIPDSALYAQGVTGNDLSCLGNWTCASAWASGSTVSYLPSTIQPPRLYNIDHVSYTGDPTYVSFNPTEDFSYPYESVMTALAATYPGTTSVMTSVWPANITATAPACTDTTTVTIGASRDPWWQVKDSDVQAQGAISSKVPSSDVFDDAPAGGFPGIPAYTTSLDTGSGTVSATGWNAQSPGADKMYDYQYFYNQIPQEIIDGNLLSINSDNVSGATPDTNGYEWYKFDGTTNGDLTINNSIDFGSRKVILLVDSADTYINANITVNGGFFIMIVGKNSSANKGNIYVDPAVTSLQGLYSADAQFKTGTDGSQTDSQLYVRGSVVAYGGVSLDRDLGDNNSSPAELFEFAPDQIMLFPTALGYRKLNWKEVAP